MNPLETPTAVKKRAAKRPAVPRSVARRLLIETGHRCAVCGDPCPLERAHIIPWRLSKTHDFEDLICLCASCHERADKEGWGEQVLREYKRNPWVLRRQSEREEPSKAKQIEVILGLELASFSEVEERLLVYGLAAFLDIPVTRIRIASVIEGSIRVILEMPRRAANNLVEAAQRRPKLLRSFLEDLAVVDLCWPGGLDLVGIGARRSGRDVAIELAPLPASISEEDLRETAMLFGRLRSLNIEQSHIPGRSYAMLVVGYDEAKKLAAHLLKESRFGHEFRVYRSACEFLGLDGQGHVIDSVSELRRPERANRFRSEVVDSAEDLEGESSTGNKASCDFDGSVADAG